MFGCSWDLLSSRRASCYWDGPLRCCAPTVLTCSLLPTSQCYHCLCPHYYRQIYPCHHSITAVTSGFDYARMILGITRCLTATGLIHVTGVTSETETFSHEAEASIKMCSIETETLEISTWARHYCATAPRDDLETKESRPRPHPYLTVVIYRPLWLVWLRRVHFLWAMRICTSTNDCIIIMVAWNRCNSRGRAMCLRILLWSLWFYNDKMCMYTVFK